MNNFTLVTLPPTQEKLDFQVGRQTD